MINYSFNLKPEEAIKAWGAKVPMTKAEYSSLVDEAKSRAFFISKLTDLQQTQRVYDSIGSAMTEGRTISDVVNELKHNDKIPLSTPHLRTIVDTNLKTAYSAGRWDQIQRTKDKRPYLQYKAVIDSRSSSDKLFNNMIFPVDDPFWTVNMPPNHFNCRCSVITLSQLQIDNLKDKLGRDPVVRTKEPIPINKDFAGNAGIPHKPDLSKYNPILREEFLNDVARHFSLQQNSEAQLKRYFNDGDAKDALILMRVGRYSEKEYGKLVRQTLINKHSKGVIMPVGQIPVRIANRLKKDGVSLNLRLITVDDKQIMHMQRDYKKELGKALSEKDVLNIPNILKDKNTRWYTDNGDKNTIIAINNGKKVVLNTKSDDGTVYVLTSGIVSERDLHLYTEVEGRK